jgi:phenylacetate-CoA ligase
MIRSFKDQWLSPPELKRLQEKKLRWITRYAYRRVPYYHRLLRTQGLRPEDIRTSSDLTRIPILNKETAKRHLSTLLARELDNRLIDWLSTSGTTASPVSVARNQEVWRIMHSLVERGKLAFWEMPWHRTMHVTHPGSQFHGGWVSRSLGLLQKIHAAFFRAVPLDRIDRAVQVVRKMADFRPKVLATHAFNLRLLSFHLDALPNDARPKVIHSGAGEVADNRTRRMIEDEFGCGMYNTYGSSELGRHGFECREQMGYHIHADHLLLECLADGEQVSDQPGEIVITDLSNVVMPIIRYRLGDLGILSSDTCPCGRGLPLLNSVEGRIDDLLVLPDGRILTPLYITSWLNEIRGMAIYRLTQHKHDEVTVEYVPSRLHTQTTVEEIQQICKTLLQPNVDVTIKRTHRKTLPQKIRPVVSKVPGKRHFGLISELSS